MSCPRFTPAVLFYRRALRPACARHCVSLAAYCPRFTPAVCLATNRTACGISRSCSAQVEIAISTFSNPRAVIKLFRFTSGTSVSLWRSRRGAGDAGNGVTRGMGLAARREYVFAQPHWLCSAFRREYAGAARPRLRQRAIGSLDSLHLIRGVGAFCAASIVRFTGALGQQPPVQRRMCFFVTTVSGRKSRDFIYSVRL